VAERDKPRAVRQPGASDLVVGLLHLAAREWQGRAAECRAAWPRRRVDFVAAARPGTVAASGALRSVALVLCTLHECSMQLEGLLAREVATCLARALAQDCTKRSSAARNAAQSACTHSSRRMPRPPCRRGKAAGLGSRRAL
jgi:hypothetical protein